MLPLRSSCMFCGIQSASTATRSAAAIRQRVLRIDEPIRETPSSYGVSKWFKEKKLPVVSKENRLKLVINRVPADEWYKMKPNGLLASYSQLSKLRLTLLITTTAVGGYALSPVSVPLSVLCACTVGTAMLSASANACNHVLESPYDAQMKRTQQRLLVIERFTPLHAVGFASSSLLVGFSILWFGTNPIAALLGLLNVFLYAGVYTPMKRHSILCTWMGAIVGAIPPVMGYAAASGTISSASLVMGLMLYCWQFPHFNALSWNLRGDYSRAGYRVMCVTNEMLCRSTSLWHSIALIALCSLAAPVTDLTSFTFALDSLPINAVLVYLSYRFYNHPDAKNSRNLFRYSLIYLPLLMAFMIVSNCGRASYNCSLSSISSSSLQVTDTDCKDGFVAS